MIEVTEVIDACETLEIVCENEEACEEPVNELLMILVRLAATLSDKLSIRLSSSEY